MTHSPARAKRALVRKIAQRLTKVHIADWELGMTVEAILNARARVSLQERLPNITIEQVEAFPDMSTPDRMVVRVWAHGRKIELTDDAFEFPSKELLAKVVLFAQT